MSTAQQSAQPPPQPKAPRPVVEVMIPTFNEREHIAQTVANALLLGPVFVLDSVSTDGTQQAARDAGATVVERAFTNYADQKNWGLDNLPFQGEWVFILDADERITPALRKEVLEKASRRRRTDGYFVNRLPIIMGQPIRHGGLYPSWNLRLFRRGRARYEERPVHEHMACAGPTDYLRHEMLHIQRETLHRYIDKHIRYAELESEEWVKWKLGQSTMAEPSTMFSSMLKYRNWVRRRVWPRTPLRPLWRFLYMYFFRFGFLDGQAGWHIARIISGYEYTIGLLYREKLRQARRPAQGDAPATPKS